MLVTCFSMNRLLESYSQIFCLQGKQNISFPYEWKLDECLGEGFCSRQWADTVLSSCSLSLFDNIHVFTFEMQSCMPWTEVCVSSGRQESCSWVSSEKGWLEMECCRISVVRGFVYKMNRMGPRTEPCGTPKLSSVACESLLLTVTVYWKGRIWTRWRNSEIPYRCSSLWERMLRSLVSGAFDRSTRITTVTSPLSKACRLSFIIFSRAVSVLCPGL